MNKNDVEHEMLRRLDIIISLMLDRLTAEEGVSVASKVHKLGSLGLAPSEIAKILGKPINYITAVRATKRARAEKS